VDVIISRQPDNTWSWSITVASIPLVDFVNSATSTTVPTTGWVNSDEETPSPFNISIAAGACPVPPVPQVCVTLCDGTLLTLTEILPTFFSSADLYYGMYLDDSDVKTDGETATWLFDYTVNGTAYQWTATQSAGSTLPPTSGWTKTSNNGCSGGISVNITGGCPKLPAGSLCVTYKGTQLDLASDSDDFTGVLDYHTADGAYTLHRNEGDLAWEFFDMTTDNAAENNASTALTVPTTGWPTIVVTTGTCTVQTCTLANVQLVGNGTLSCTTPTLSLTALGGSRYAFSGPGIVSQFNGTEPTIIGSYIINRRAIPTLGTAVVNKPGTYTVLVTGENGCSSTATITVTGTECR